MKDLNIKYFEITVWRQKLLPASLLLLILLYLSCVVLNAAESEGQTPVRMNLLQGDSAQPVEQQATSYLKRVIEHRTNFRVLVDIQLSPPAQGSGLSDIQIIVADKADQIESWQEFSDIREHGGSSDIEYRVVVRDATWSCLSDELKVILRGAAKDTLAYLAELNNSNL